MNQEDKHLIDRRDFLSLTTKKALPFLGVMGFGAWMSGCGSESDPAPDPSGAITTAAASNITETSATLGGNITSTGTPPFTERGVCYATTRNPTINHIKRAVTGMGTGSFSASVTGLTPNTSYYVRAYAINDNGAVYGNEENFTTSATPGNSPALTTTAASSISATGATLGGNITNAGTPAYTERGVCYATTQNPTTANNKRAVAGTGTGSFSTAVTGLSANTRYYVRAYAINTAGTEYGNEVNFTTSAAQTCATCTATCQQTCGVTCTNTCGSGCYSGCSGGCDGSCLTTCVTTCRGFAETSCGSYCGKSCSSGCITSCTGRCDRSCNTTCGGTCRNYCTNTAS